MSQRHAVTKAVATRYKGADKFGKGVIVDELCATAGWLRNPATQGPEPGFGAEDRPAA